MAQRLATKDELFALVPKLRELEPAEACLLEEYLEQYPDSFSTLSAYAGLLAGQGEIEAAEQAIAQAETLRPGYYPLHFIRYVNEVLRQDWQAAAAHTAKIGELPMPFAKAAVLGLEVNLLF